MSAKEEYIIIEGAKVNNLKNVSLKIPRGKLTVISGLSGSGKSSLAFETLFAEGQRRFAESLSSFARQFLGRMSKPSVEKIEGIPPAIAISQKVNSANPRSTVGTTTEIYDYLRVLYAKIGHTYSPVSGREVKCENINDVLRHIFTLAGKVYIVCPVKWGLDDKVEQLLNLSESGFSRLFNMDSKVMLRISDLLKEMGKYKDDSLYLLIGRFSMEGNEEKPSEETVASMQDSLQTAFDQGGGHLAIVCETPDGNFHTREFSNIFESDGIVFEKPTELMFSYNNPLGACPVCKGLGMTTGIDETLVVPNSSLSVYEGAIAPWRGEIMGQFQKKLILNAPKFGFPIHKPYAQLTAEQKGLLWKGNRYFTGINSFFEMVDSMKYKIQYKYLLSRYSGKTVCHACHGSRLKKECEYVKVGGKSISELMSMSIDRLYDFFSTLKLDKYEEQVAKIDALQSRYTELTGKEYVVSIETKTSSSPGVAAPAPRAVSVPIAFDASSIRTAEQVMSEFYAKVQDNDAMQEIFGDDFNAVEANIEAVHSALSVLINDFDMGPASSEVQDLLSYLAELESQSNSVGAGLKKMAKELEAWAESAATSFAQSIGSGISDLVTDFMTIDEQVEALNEELDAAKEEQLDRNKDLLEAEEEYRIALLEGNQTEIDAALENLEIARDQQAAQDKKVESLEDEIESTKNGTKAWEDFGRAALLALADVLESLGAQLAAQAVVNAVAYPPNYVNAGIAAAGSVAAYVAAGLIRGWAGKYAKGGVVPQVAGVPSTGDQHIARVNPGELILNKAQQGNIAQLLTSQEALLAMKESEGDRSSRQIVIELNGDVYGLDSEEVGRAIYRNIRSLQEEGRIDRWR